MDDSIHSWMGQREAVGPVEAREWESSESSESSQSSRVESSRQSSRARPSRVSRQSKGQSSVENARSSPHHPRVLWARWAAGRLPSSPCCHLLLLPDFDDHDGTQSRASLLQAVQKSPPVAFAQSVGA